MTTRGKLKGNCRQGAAFCSGKCTAHVVTANTAQIIYQECYAVYDSSD